MTFDFEEMRGRYEEAIGWKSQAHTDEAFGEEVVIRDLYRVRVWDWSGVGAFVDADGTFYWTIEDGRLKAHFSIDQRNTARGSKKLLEDIRGFLDKRLGTTGRVVPVAHEMYRLKYRRLIDVYKCANALIPNMRLPYKIREATNTMAAIESYITAKRGIMAERIRRGSLRERMVHKIQQNARRTKGNKTKPTTMIS